MAAARNTGTATSPRSACHSPYSPAAVAASIRSWRAVNGPRHPIRQLDIGGNAHGRGHEELLRRERGGRDGGGDAAVVTR